MSSRLPRRRSPLLFLLALSSLFASTASGTSLAPPLIGRGFHTVEGLGSGVVLLPSEATDDEHTMQYRLPLGARQGAGQWYLVRLHARIRFTATPRSGFVDLIAGTNGNTCALVEFVKQAGAPLRWSSVSWVEGRQRGHDTGSGVDVQMTNLP